MPQNYKAPTEEVKFLLNEVINLKEVLALPKFKDIDDALVSAVIEEAGKFASEQLSPLNTSGDREGCKIKGDSVITPSGFKEAYKSFVETGWNSVVSDGEFGGQGLPFLISSAISEFWSAANMSFALCPLLTAGSIELLIQHGSDEQKQEYLHNLVSGKWTGTMCLTEPQAGSDVGAVATKALKDGDKYLIKGQKIFITYGEHDFTENIIHMVLARTPDAPKGSKGISLFIVPKILSDGTRNDVRVIGIEHKLGIHASPTCTMSFGDEKGAIGYLVGKENEGLKYMFTMMNNARLAVGIEGVALAENSLQQAEAYAAERVQGVPLSGKAGDTIEGHPDVRRMLLTIGASALSYRLLSYFAAYASDIAHNHVDEKVREKYQNIVDILIPIVKAGATDIGFEMSSMAVQVFGGLGFIEETGIAQNLRDSRIAMIYEGTNGIQALDLVFRKLKNINDLLEVFEVKGKLLESVMQPLEKFSAKTPEEQAFAACYVNELLGIVLGGCIIAKAGAAAARLKNSGTYNAKMLQKIIDSSEFYQKYIMPKTGYLSWLVTI